MLHQQGGLPHPQETQLRTNRMRVTTFLCGKLILRFFTLAGPGRRGVLGGSVFALVARATSAGIAVVLDQRHGPYAAVVQVCGTCKHSCLRAQKHLRFTSVWAANLPCVALAG